VLTFNINWDDGEMLTLTVWFADVPQTYDVFWVLRLQNGRGQKWNTNKSTQD